MRRLVAPVAILAWLIFLIGPIGLLFAPSSAIEDGWLTGLPTAFVELLGDRWGRWVFSGLWITMNAALAWRLVVSKKPYDPGPSLDAHD